MSKAIFSTQKKNNQQRNTNSSDSSSSNRTKKVPLRNVNRQRWNSKATWPGGNPRENRQPSAPLHIISRLWQQDRQSVQIRQCRPLTHHLPKGRMDRRCRLRKRFLIQKVLTTQQPSLFHSQVSFQGCDQRWHQFDLLPERTVGYYNCHSLRLRRRQGAGPFNTRLR